MSNVAHSSLTGADLHESKGVASASADTVFVTDGAGSGVHKKVPSTALSSSANPFGAQLLHVRHELPPGTSYIPTVGWFQLLFQQVKTNEIASASLSSNEVLLPTGTYFFEATCPTGFSGTNTAGYQLRLRNVTSNTTLLVSPQMWNVNATGNSAGTLLLSMRGRFSLGSTSNIQLQYWSNAASHLGGANNTGEVNVAADLLIWKVQ
jgi:hypothetical protein